MKATLPVSTLGIAIRWVAVAAVGIALFVLGRWIRDGLEGWLWLIYVVAAPSYAVWLVVLEGRASRSRDSLRGVRCPTCNYDLRATPDRCPECGTVVAKQD